ncbi:MAG: hypothetical protein E6J45_05095 [Chloroflexi bacterium]|nr:MAG: hypothetical protein E6J45_05095 [Chloroflexota bacterium]
MRGWLRRMPRPVLLVALFLALTGAFIVVVGPLFSGSGAAAAELAGALPTQATSGRPFEVDLAYDNTGAALISPVCVGTAVSGPLQPQYAIFLSVDRVPYAKGAVCGGSLGAGDAISIRMFFTATAPGTATYRLTPRQGRRSLGPSLSATVEIAPR